MVNAQLYQTTCTMVQMFHCVINLEQYVLGSDFHGHTRIQEHPRG